VAALRGVTCYFDSPVSVRALAGVSFAVRRGEVFGLLGSAGSGKSTAMRVLAGTLSPSDGKASVFGASPRRRGSRAKIGYLPQEPGHARSHFWARLTGLVAGSFRTARAKALGSKAAAKGTGFDRRSLLKQILVKSPGLVLLDEPFSDFHGPAGEELRELIRSFSQQGRTVILTARSLSWAVGLCDRVAILCRGRVEATGPIEELLATPQSLRYVGELLPAATAERALRLVRQELGVGSPCTAPGTASPETGQAGTDGIAQGLPSSQASDSRQPAPGPSVRRTTAGCEANRSLAPGVNHEMLAALTKANSEPPQAPESKPASGKA
jgi:ABC-type multidrug transport system ATPase subunit